MSGTFDAYHVWLGIPASEQPPNHYRLLGIPLFENDGDVIDHAADRQMAHVRTFQAGRNGALSQQLLNELSAARLCLLNPAKKSAYDDQLRAKIDGSVPKAAPAIPLVKAQPVVAKAVPQARPVSRAPASSTPANSAQANSAQAGSASRRSPDPLEIEVDEDVMDTLVSAPDFQIRAARPKYAGTPGWKRSAALGIMAGVVAICFFLIYWLVQTMMRSDDWKRFILGDPEAGVSAPDEPTPLLEHDAAPPPKPAPAE